MRNRTLATLAVSLALAAGAPAIAWDASGHQTIALLALDRFTRQTTIPAWLSEESTRRMIAWESGEPDRWRGLRTATLRHENEPDHYLDVEDLTPFGLTLRTVPVLRHEYVKVLTLARERRPEAMKPYNPAMDPAKTQEYPGFLPQAIMEHYEKLRSSMSTVRILQGLPDAASDRRKLQIEQAKANVREEMGLLAHFVGDAAQPLHTTQHHHGWIGDNPKGYTTDKGIHSRIDGAVLTLHKLNYETLKAPAADPQSGSASPTTKPADDAPRVTDPQNPWGDVLTHIERSFAKVEPLYELQKSGDLDKEPGKAFITERLKDGGAMLGDLYAAAWKVSEPTTKDVEDYVKYESKE